MSKKYWSSSIVRKPKSIFFTTHKDKIGGGDLYAHQIAKSFDKATDMRYYGPSYHRLLSKNHGFSHEFKHTSIQTPCDIFVACSHFLIPSPIGRERNIFVSFFPNKDMKDAIKPYDTIVTCSHFSSYYIREYWKKDAFVIYPYEDKERLFIGKTDRGSITNISRFFRESSGHSKNQHILIEAFSILHKNFPDTKLNLIGSVLTGTDQAYLDHCKSLAVKLGLKDNVIFHPNCTYEEKRKILSRSDVYWHSNGYKSTNPYESEHFGIVFVEAMLSGCPCFAYDFGSVKEFKGLSEDFHSWSNIEKLVEETSRYLRDPITVDARKIIRSNASGAFLEEQMDHRVKNLLYKD